MPENNVSRRGLLQIIGAVPAAAAVAAGTASAQQAHDHAHMAAQTPSAPSGPYKRQTFDDHQWQTVGVLCDLIIPACLSFWTTGSPFAHAKAEMRILKRRFSAV